MVVEMKKPFEISYINSDIIRQIYMIDEENSI